MRIGVSMLGISDAAESIGFRTLGVKTDFEQLSRETPLPCILHWNQNHFVVCCGIKRTQKGEYKIKISDPARERMINKSLRLLGLDEIKGVPFLKLELLNMYWLIS